MANDKIMERIRRLLAMAGDQSSPHEAAIAAKRARKLMDEYQVTELDLTTLQTDDFGETTADEYGKRMPTWYTHLAISAADINDCIADIIWIKADKSAIRFRGMLVDSVCATEIFKYLIEMMEKNIWKHRGRIKKQSYRAGFASGVAKQVKEILAERNKLKMSDGKALVVSKMAMVTDKYGPAGYTTSKSNAEIDYTAYAKGHNDGKNASLNRQVKGETQKQIGVDE